MVFEKLYKFVGKDIKSMMERPDGHYCLRLHKNRVYYVSEALMKKATNVSEAHGQAGSDYDGCSGCGCSSKLAALLAPLKACSWHQSHEVQPWTDT